MFVMDLTVRAASADDAMRWAAALRRSGQCAPPWPAFVSLDGAWTFRLQVPAEDSLDPRHDSAEVADTRSRLGAIDIRRIGRAVESADACACGARPFLVLFTTFICDAPPLRCGACWGLVPLYQVPSERGDGDHGDLLGWASSYRHLDGLYMQSGVGEAFAYAELSRRGSAFGAETLRLCARYEGLARSPVYAYLNRSHGAPPESCPECSKPWEREPAAGPWAYRCESCRILLPEPTDDKPPG